MTITILWIVVVILSALFIYAMGRYFYLMWKATFRG